MAESTRHIARLGSDLTLYLDIPTCSGRALFLVDDQASSTMVFPGGRYAKVEYRISARLRAYMDRSHCTLPRHTQVHNCMTTKAAVVHSKCESCDISAYAVARRLSALEVERSISSECGDYASYSACYQERKKKKKKKKSVMQPRHSLPSLKLLARGRYRRRKMGMKLRREVCCGSVEGCYRTKSATCLVCACSRSGSEGLSKRVELIRYCRETH